MAHTISTAVSARTALAARERSRAEAVDPSELTDRRRSATSHDTIESHKAREMTYSRSRSNYSRLSQAPGQCVTFSESSLSLNGQGG
jgi:hypothetical protein